MKVYDRKAQSKVAGVVILVLMLLIGVLIGVAWYRTQEKGVVPDNHNTIAEAISIFDIDYNTTLQCHFIGSSFTPMLSSIQGEWLPLTPYHVSEWSWKTGDDPNAYMNIWGPSNDGISYSIEISKMCANTLKVVCPEGTYLLDEAMPKLQLYIQLGG